MSTKATNAQYNAAGTQGPQGIPGPSGAGQTFDFPLALSTWVVNHNLGRMPSVDVYTIGGVSMMGQIVHVSVNQATVNFESPITGFVIIT